MSEGLGPRARAALQALRAGKFLLADGWHEIGRMENVGQRTLEELARLDELEFEGWPGSGGGFPAWRRVRVRFREERPSVGDDRVVVLLAEILAVLRDRL